MIVKKALLLATIATFSAGCAVDATGGGTDTGSNGPDPAPGTLTREQGLELAQAVEARALQEAAAEAESGAKDLGDGVSQKSEAILGSDSCKDVDLLIKNLRTGDTKIIAVQFWSSTDGKWRYEDLDNKVLTPGDYATWTPNLSYTKNDYITHWKIKYEDFMGYDNWGVKKWSSGHYSDEMRASQGDSIKCVRSANFSLTLDRNNE